ncbi:MAG: PilZ domain-containing protein [Myxococcota bacterium]
MSIKKRSAARIELDELIGFSIDGGPRVVARCLDLTTGGMFIASTASPAYGATIIIDIDLPGLTLPSIEAVVRWSRQGGFGVQFGKLSPDDTKAIAAFLASYGPAPKQQVRAANPVRTLVANLGPATFVAKLKELVGDGAFDEAKLCEALSQATKATTA